MASNVNAVHPKAAVADVISVPRRSSFSPTSYPPLKCVPGVPRGRIRQTTLVDAPLPRCIYSVAYIIHDYGQLASFCRLIFFVFNFVVIFLDTLITN